MTSPGRTEPSDLDAVHARLKAIFAPYRDRLAVSGDSPDGMYLELPGYEGQTWGFVGGTRRNKHYVSFYLMGVYGNADLAASISPELKRRMQGKSCFNFTRVDEALFRELETLTARSIELQPAMTAAVLANRKDRRRA